MGFPMISNTFKKAVTRFLGLELKGNHSLSDQELSVLYDISQILELPHLAQELLSSERTPTLSMTLPTYSILLDEWKKIAAQIPELEYYVNAGIEKIEQYIAEARKTPIFGIAMNPSFAFLIWFYSEYLIQSSIQPSNLIS